jgi:hypothetical protein
MAAPKRAFSPVKLDEMRSRIRATLILNKLENHALGTEGAEMTSTQLKAAEVLLRKCMPDLSSMEMTGEGGGPIQQSLTVDFVKPDDPVPG